MHQPQLELPLERFVGQAERFAVDRARPPSKPRRPPAGWNHQSVAAELLEAIPDAVSRIVDLGCGDGRLIELVLDAHPELIEAAGLDNSPPMLELARQRFAGEHRVAIKEHDLDQVLNDLNGIDAVISGSGARRKETRVLTRQITDRWHEPEPAELRTLI